MADDVTETTSGRVIVFDADGVLVDSHAGYAVVWDRWSTLHGLDPAVVLAATHARRPVDTIADVAPHLDAAAEYARLVEYVNEMPSAFPVFADAAALLAHLPADRWAIVTSGDADRVRERLRAGGLPVPAVIVDGTAVERGKPDPEGYLLAAQRLATPAAACLVVEDAPAGLAAARAAGMTTVGLTTSHPADALTTADRVFDSLHQAQPHLLRWMTATR